MQNLTSEIHEIARHDLKTAQRMALDAVGESGMRRYFEFKGRQSCIRKAQLKPLPGDSADAFIKGATRVDDVVVREILPIHIACLQAVNSPLLELVSRAAESKEKKSDADFNEDEQNHVCFIMTEDPKTLRKMLKDGGESAIKEKATDAIQDNWNAAKINMVMLAVIEQFHRHVKTSVKFAGEVEAQGDKSFFQGLTGKVLKQPESAGS